MENCKFYQTCQNPCLKIFFTLLDEAGSFIRSFWGRWKGSITISAGIGTSHFVAGSKSREIVICTRYLSAFLIDKGLFVLNFHIFPIFFRAFFFVYFHIFLFFPNYWNAKRSRYFVLCLISKVWKYFLFSLFPWEKKEENVEKKRLFDRRPELGRST